MMWALTPAGEESRHRGPGEADVILSITIPCMWLHPLWRTHRDLVGKTSEELRKDEVLNGKTTVWKQLYWLVLSQLDTSWRHFLH